MQGVVPSKYKDYQDDWGTSAREGYEDHGPVRPMRASQHEPGSPVLRTLGGLAIVAGICWGTYLVTQGADIRSVLEHNRGPVAIAGLGVIASLLGKFLRV